jgi:hypothetical protein
MAPSEMQAIQHRWSAILNAMMAAGILRDDLTILAIVVGAHHLEQRFIPREERRTIGFAPAGRKES